MAMYFWVKERHNPQFSRPAFYFVGRMPIKNAKKLENSIYGYNVMHKFETDEKAIEFINEKDGH